MTGREAIRAAIRLFRFAVSEMAATRKADIKTLMMKFIGCSCRRPGRGPGEYAKVWRRCSTAHSHILRKCFPRCRVQEDLDSSSTTGGCFFGVIRRGSKRVLRRDRVILRLAVPLGWLTGSGRLLDRFQSLGRAAATALCQLLQVHLSGGHDGYFRRGANMPFINPA